MTAIPTDPLVLLAKAPDKAVMRMKATSMVLAEVMNKTRRPTFSTSEAPSTAKRTFQTCRQAEINN